MVTVKLHTFLKKYHPAGGEVNRIEYRKGMTVQEVLEHLGLDAGAVGLILVNGRLARANCELAEGDAIDLYPVFGGG
ncbi:MAG: MoaD/ThiS family protein [Pelotomaculum sp.]|nr:MoaD/ThiS family protein [Pelotomaculum sp.]